jgi:catechol 2,3-dioxygenase-like lactoylglutathione lyase family enzyme
VRGANHIGISVGDLDASADWYRKVFGDPPSLASMREEQFGIEYLLATPSSTVGLHWSAATPPDDRFSEFRCGLDHLAFGVEGGGAIEEWKDHLDGLGVSHSGVTETDYGRILVFRDPDNVQLELFATPS